MKPNNRKKNRKYSIKQLLFAGLIVWLPIVTSIWVISYIVSMTDSLINLLPRAYRPEQLLGFQIPGLGLIIAIIVLLATGLFTANVIGKNIIKLWDNVFSKIPFIKSIYFGVKKVSESIFSDSRESFKNPILVEFPHPNSWTIGFITGSTPSSVS
ncbi:MAG: DUF502 domain-containing protein, partial [Neisseriaceae bacterium]|nr:DUF502 domain-containing protein [Neisseriaceae bacterium]